MKIIRTYYDETLQHIVNVYETVKSPALQSPIYCKTINKKQSSVHLRPSVSNNIDKTSLRNVKFFHLKGIYSF